MDERDRLGRDSDSPLAELVESVTRKLVTAMVIAGGLIGLGLWSSRPSTRAAHYQLVAAEGRIYRLNTESGWMIGCEGNRCGIVLRSGRDLEDDIPPRPAPRQLAPPAPAPAPAPAPGLAPAPSPAPAPAAR